MLSKHEKSVSKNKPQITKDFLTRREVVSSYKRRKLSRMLGWRCLADVQYTSTRIFADVTSFDFLADSFLRRRFERCII